MKFVAQVRKLVVLRMFPEPPVLGRWKNDNNYIKTNSKPLFNRQTVDPKR